MAILYSERVQDDASTRARYKYLANAMYLIYNECTINKCLIKMCEARIQGGF